jgi:hypothetical protein
MCDPLPFLDAALAADLIAKRIVTGSLGGDRRAGQLKSGCSTQDDSGDSDQPNFDYGMERARHDAENTNKSCHELRSSAGMYPKALAGSGPPYR